GATAGSFAGARSVFAKIVNDGARSGDRLRMAVEAESGQLRDAELLAQDALGVIVLEDPVFNARFDAASAVQQRSLRGFEELLRPRKKRFARMKQLQFVAKVFVGTRARKFCCLELAGGKINVGE